MSHLFAALISRGQRLWCVVSLVAALLATGCAPKPPRTKGATTCVVCLFDLSASAGAQATKGRYLQDFGKVVSALHAGDLVIADAITENPSATMTFSLRASLPAYDAWQTSPLLYRQEIQTVKTGLIDQVSSLVRKTPATRRTAILDALYVTRKAFNSEECRKAAQRVFIGFSDMEEDSERANFLRTDLSLTHIELFLRKEQQQGHIPDLRDVQVWIAGATPDRVLDPDRIRAIEAFWAAYFTRAGASFRSDRYGPALLNFLPHSPSPLNAAETAGL